jgi:DNA-binding transcriptional ArsR family regulator
MTEARSEQQQRRVTITDPQVMRAMAHPARLAIMEYLGPRPGGATATECAGIVGLSPSATSYHLRALARAGLVEEAPSRGDARERLWRTFSPGFEVDPGQSAGPEARAAELALVEAHVTRDVQRIREWLRHAAQEPPEWYEAMVVADSLVLLTAEELAEVNDAVERLLEPYRRSRRTDPPEGARTVMVQYRAVPTE